MALSQSGSYQGDISRSNSYWIYALRRDEEGMLYFTKVSSASTETDIDVGMRYDGTQVEQFGDYQDYVTQTTEEKTYSNNPQDKYQQFRFDSRNLNYYIDDDGYFVLKVTGIHTYSGPV